MTAGNGKDDDNDDDDDDDNNDDDDKLDHCYRRQQEILASGMIDLQNINNNLQSQLETTRQTLRETQIRKVCREWSDAKNDSQIGQDRPSSTRTRKT